MLLHLKEKWNCVFQCQLTAVGGHVAPARHQAVLVGHGAAGGQGHGLHVVVENGGAAQLDQHDVIVQVVAVVLRVLDHLGAVDPLLGAFVHGDVVLTETDLNATEREAIQLETLPGAMLSTGSGE